MASNEIELIALVVSLGISDKFIFGGFVRRTVARRVPFTRRVFVMSSVSEPFGLTALEAAHQYRTLLASSRAWAKSWKISFGLIIGTINWRTQW